jgi:adenylate kinase family enzyme
VSPLVHRPLPLAAARSHNALVGRRIAVIASASGNGKTTLGREAARRLGVPFVELDAWVHGPGWVETPDADLRARVSGVLAREGWVIDGQYRRKLGDMVLRAADEVVWLDLPLRIWLFRLLRRTGRRRLRREELWNGNRETLRTAFWGRDSLVGYALLMHFRRRREWPAGLGDVPVTRLRTPGDVEAWLGALPRGRPD